jgi:hypothetical protein
MAPLTKIKHHEDNSPSKIVSIGAPAAPNAQPAKKGEGSHSNKTSYQQAMAITYQMLMAIAIDMGTISKGYNQAQSDQASLATAQSKETDTQTQKLMAQFAAIKKEQASAHAWGIFGTVMKWVGVALAAVVGALLCETPLGFAILAGVIALTASGVLNKGLTCLGDKLGQAIGSSTWGNIIVQFVAIAVLTVATAGAEAGYTAVAASRVASQAGEAAGQAALNAADTAIEEATEEAASNAAEDAAAVPAQTTSTAADSAGTVDKTNFSTNFKNSLNGYATRTTAVTSLTSTNIIGELVKESVEHIPGLSKTAKEWIETIATIAITLAVTFASFKGMTQSESFLSKLTTMTPQLKVGALAVQAGGTFAKDGATVGVENATIESANLQAKQGPVQAAIDKAKGMTNTYDSLIKVTQQVMESIINASKPLFSINFGAGWQAAAQGLA